MIINIKPRRAGKTTKAVEWLNNNKNGILVTFNKREKKRLLNEEFKSLLSSWQKFKKSWFADWVLDLFPLKYKTTYIDKRRIITINDVTNNHYLNGRRNIYYLDNADIILQQMFNFQLVEVSLSSETKVKSNVHNYYVPTEDDLTINKHIMRW